MMNGYSAPSQPSGSFPSYSPHINGHGSHSPELPQRNAKSSAKALYGSEGPYFFRTSAKHKKKQQRKNYTKTSINSLTDTSQYHVEHLTTFVMDRKEAMITIEDGIRKLRLLDAKGKVWTQDMLLQVDEKAVSLIDADSKNELENFPMGTLQHCQSVMSACSYDSILALVCKESGQGKPDLHLFQCDDIKANLIQADIDSAISDYKGGKVKKRPDALRMILKSGGCGSGGGGGGIPPPPAAPAPEPPAQNSQVDVKSRAAAWSAWANEQQEYDPQEQYPDQDEPAEMTAARVDRDVQILNHILDDIEYFVTKLQKAAEAFNELSKRKKSKKNKKKGPGEGVLTLRAKPPGQEEFVDCFQKFKCAFNLLAKLKNHISNPSAVDLVHFLFTPLRMVIQTSGGVDLAKSVLVPLPTREGVEFLHSSCTVEEKQLWAALGDGWTKSRMEWPKEQVFPVYVPRFRDGWEPPVLTYVGSPREQELNRLAETLAHAELQRQEEMAHRLSQEQLNIPQDYPCADGYAFANSTYQSIQLLEPELTAATIRQALSHHVDRTYDVYGRTQPKNFAKSKYDFVARNSTELSVVKDEVVEVLDDRKQWWKVRNGAGMCGYVPNNILEISRAVDMTGRGEPIYSHTIQLMMPKKEFELFKQLLGELNEKQRTDYVAPKPAITPVTPVPPAPTPPPPAPAPAPARLPTPPLPPAAAPPPMAEPPQQQQPQQPSNHTGENGGVTMREQPKERPPLANRRKSNMEEVQDELMHRLTLGRSAQKKFPVPPRSAGAGGAPAGNLTYDSPPEHVKGWLEAKGFSAVTINSLGVLTGAQLFSLNKDELKTVCPDDGARVFSQVTVQKAALERSSGNELQEIMRRRQEKLAAVASDSGVESFDESSSH